eukprot:scaffold4247_cov66-Cylindrotheca_fusiformis.AAC.18
MLQWSPISLLLAQSTRVSSSHQQEKICLIAVSTGLSQSSITTERKAGCVLFSFHFGEWASIFQILLLSSWWSSGHTPLLGPRRKRKLCVPLLAEEYPNILLLIHHDELKELFEVDTKSTCKKTPEPDEIVFHFRNFITEFTTAIELGFGEMDPDMTAKYLFANYTSGEKAAIVSRYQQKTGDYKKALKDTKGIEARYIENQTGVEDFCFLLKAKRELIAVKKSTFATLAAYLGDIKRARLYSFDTPERRARGRHYYTYSFKHQKLRDRIIFENYNAFGRIDKLR